MILRFCAKLPNQNIKISWSQLKFLCCETWFLMLSIIIEKPENQKKSKHNIIMIKSIKFIKWHGSH